MIKLPSDLLIHFKKQENIPFIILIFNLRNNQKLYYTNLDIAIVIDYYEYKPLPFTIENANYSINTQVDEITIVIDNVSLIPVSIFLNEDQRGSEVIIKYGVLDENYQYIGSFEVFRGFINSVRIVEEKNTSFCEVNLTHELSFWKKDTLRKQISTCPWRFRDNNCRYRGSSNKICNKTWTMCAFTFRNSANFGGFPNLEHIEHKEILWGKKR